MLEFYYYFSYYYHYHWHIGIFCDFLCLVKSSIIILLSLCKSRLDFFLVLFKKILWFFFFSKWTTQEFKILNESRHYFWKKNWIVRYLHVWTSLREFWYSRISSNLRNYKVKVLDVSIEFPKIWIFEMVI